MLKSMKITEETKKVEGIYGKYGVRRVGNQIHTRIRKKINSIPTDFVGKGATLELSIADLEKKIDIALNKDFVIDNNITVEEWCRHWLETKRNKPSFEYFEQHVRCYILPVIGNMKLAEVRLENLNKITQKMANGELSEPSRKKGLSKQELKASKKPLLKKTIDNVKNTISQIFQDAIDNEKIRQIPLSKIKNDGMESEGRVVLSKEQKSKLLNFLVNDEKEDTKTVSLMLLIQYTRGLRASEVCGLKWKDIDLDKKQLNLKQGCGRVRQFDENLKPTGKYKTELKQLKTKNSKRTLNFDDIIFEKLDILNKQSHNEDDLIFHTKTGLNHTCKSIYKIFQRILKKLDLPSIGTHRTKKNFCNKFGVESSRPKNCTISNGTC